MAEYRALRERHTLLEICRNPDLATEVTLQPIRRVDLDDLDRDTPGVVREAVRLGAAIRAVAPVRTSLEEIYLRAVGEAEA